MVAKRKRLGNYEKKIAEGADYKPYIKALLLDNIDIILTYCMNLLKYYIKYKSII